MSKNDRDLIEQIKRRHQDRAIATDGGIHPRKALPAVTKVALGAAQKLLGFNLPEVVRTLYLEVGNGGFGPEYGIVGITGGAKLDGCTLEECYASMLALQDENPIWCWPEQLLPLANYGCGMWSCVDCSYKRLPMILWDPNNLDSDLESAEAQLNWGNSFWDQSATINAWLSGWLAGRPEVEPKWPTDAWMKERLGYTTPEQ